MPTFGSLFSGIGGLDLGLERAGWECRWQVEIDEWCRSLLARHWPGVPRFGAVESLRSNPLGDGLEGIEPGRTEARAVERVDLVCGGFPCQPVSVAGKRLAQGDVRWLWPEFARILRVLRPRFVLVENVPGLLARGMGDVLGDLAALGFNAEWDCIPAAAAGAPHLRYRVLLVAYADERELRVQPAGLTGSSGAAVAADDGVPRDVADAASQRPIGFADPAAGHDGNGANSRREETTGGATRSSQTGPAPNVADSQDPDGWRAGRAIYPWWRDQEAGRRSLRRVGAEHWLVEPDMGRVADGVPRRVDRLRGLGNAVVPQVAEWIGRRLMEVMSEQTGT